MYVKFKYVGTALYIMCALHFNYFQYYDISAKKLYHFKGASTGWRYVDLGGPATTITRPRSAHGELQCVTIFLQVLSSTHELNHNHKLPSFQGVNTSFILLSILFIVLLIIIFFIFFFIYQLLCYIISTLGFYFLLFTFLILLPLPIPPGACTPFLKSP